MTIQGVVTLGAGKTIDTRTDAYVQDNSGRGINIFQFDTVDTTLVRGNLVRITGTVEEFNGITEITNYTSEVVEKAQPLPTALKLSTSDATDTQYEGTLIQTSGVISDLFAAGGGTNIIINDGSGEVTLRVWDTTGLNVSPFAVGDTIRCVAVMDIFNNAGQLTPAYNGDIFFTSIEQAADGSGIVSVLPDQVNKSEAATLSFTFTGNSADTVSQISINVPNEWSFTSNPNDVGLSGSVFGSAQVGINGRQVLITDAVIEDRTQGEIQIGGLTAPAVDTVSVFTVQSAGTGGSLTEVAISPTVMVGKGTAVQTVPMDSIQKNIDFWNGKQVAIQGVVTIGAGVLITSRTSAYVNDSTAFGLQVFSFDPPDPAIERGNLVLIRGTIEEFNAITEITDYTVRVLRRNVDLPTPLQITTKQATGLGLEGSWVRLSGTIVDKYSAGGGTNIIVDDGSGEVTIRVWDTAGLDLTDFTAGDGIVAKGIIGEFSDTGQLLVGYQEDIGFVVLPKAPIGLKVPNKPFVPDRGELFDITFSAGSENTQVTIRIYDLAGRLITTLLDDQGRSFEQTLRWNGRDQLNELVPLGAYILHLEVVDESTGKTTQKTAPIVVGTILK